MNETERALLMALANTARIGRPEIKELVAKAEAEAKAKAEAKHR